MITEGEKHAVMGLRKCMGNIVGHHKYESILKGAQRRKASESQNKTSRTR
jgi:hypothetical protein